MGLLVFALSFEVGLNLMTLWHLLLGICFAIPITGMVASAQQANLKPTAWILAISMAVGVGLISALGMWASGRMLSRRMHAFSPKQEGWALRGLYLGGLLCLLGVAALSVWLSSAVVNILR